VLTDMSDKPLLCNVSVGVLWCADHFFFVRRGGRVGVEDGRRGRVGAGRRVWYVGAPDEARRRARRGRFVGGDRVGGRCGGTAPVRRQKLFNLFETLKLATADVLTDVSDEPLLCNVSVGVLWCVDVLAPGACALLVLFMVFWVDVFGGGHQDGGCVGGANHILFCPPWWPYRCRGRSTWSRRRRASRLVRRWDQRGTSACPPWSFWRRRCCR